MPYYQQSRPQIPTVTRNIIIITNDVTKNIIQMKKTKKK